MASAPAATRSWMLVPRTPDGTVEERVLAREAGLHPDLVRRLVRLGAVEPVRGFGPSALFPRDAAMRLARIARLRRDLGLNVAGAILACDLLARIDDLEARLRRAELHDFHPR
jgi:hypothetical protein